MTPPIIPFVPEPVIPDLFDIQGSLYGHKHEILEKVIGKIPEVSKLIILTDIVNFSMRDSRQQIEDIVLFQLFLKSNSFQNKISFKQNINIEKFIPTGDGCYIIADEDNPEKAVNYLIKMISELKKFSSHLEEPIDIRVSALLGNCFPFRDVANNLNFIGDGMNEASRIMSGGQKKLEEQFMKENGLDPVEKESQNKANDFSKNSLFLGDSLAKEAEKYKAELDRMCFYESVPDKHGLTRNITALVGIK